MSRPWALRRLLRRAAPLLLASSLAAAAYPAVRVQAQPPVRIMWQDVAAFHGALQARGVTAATFPEYVERLREEHAQRVREGDLDHLVFYLLQSNRFTSLPRIEPALSAKALVEGLAAAERTAFLESGAIERSQVAPAVRARVAAFLDTVGPSRGTLTAGPLRGTRSTGEVDARLEYFRELVTTAFPDAAAREAALLGEYLRVMQFLYRQEFIAQRSADAPAAVRDLYQRRGFSTDTAVEAGFIVHSGLGIVKALEPNRRVRRVLIVGPGLDLAPRTAFVEGPAESYQPWAVIDGLLALGLADEDTLEVVAADINPRVVAHLRRARTDPPTLSLWTASGDGVELTEDYRDYFGRLGSSIRVPANTASAAVAPGSRMRQVAVRPEVARMLRAVPLDIVTERLDAAPFDLVIATNILPYFDDTSLMLAMTNIARMLAPGGVFLHNEPRPVLGDITDALGMPYEQSRHAVIARVVGASAPLGDSIWIHRKGKGPRAKG